MESIIEARVILGILCFFHLFLGYAGSSGAVHNVISRKCLNTLLIIELIGVTAFVIYDNLQTPPYDGWVWAIIGYLFVYALILLTWFVYLPYTLLKKGKVYKMKITNRSYFMGSDYLGGFVTENNRQVDVLLPYKEEYLAPDTPREVDVVFCLLMHGEYIVRKVKEAS